MVLEGTDPMKAMEWNELTITFAWEAGEPTLGIRFRDRQLSSRDR